MNAVTILRMGQCAKRVDAHVRARETLKQRRELNMLAGKRAIEEEDVSVDELLKLSKGETMSLTKVGRTVQGMKLEKLQEEYEGIPVFDGEVTVVVNPSGQLTGEASGYLIQDIDSDITTTRSFLSEQETLEIAIRAEGDQLLRDKIRSVTSKKRIYVDGNHKAHVADYIHYLIEEGEVKKRPTFLIDTQTGEILQRWNTLDTFSCGKRAYKAYGGNEKIGKIKYGNKPYCLTMRKEGDICYLENEYVKVVDMQSTEFENISETASFKCKDGYEDEVNGGYSPAVDAFFYGTLVGKMFEEWYNTKALREKIVIRVHYGSLLENAFWNGDNCTLGDGGESFYPMTSLDLIGHEIGHGVTEQGSDLMYFGEMGGVNEAFSDMLGETAEEYLRWSDFVVGNDISKTDDPVRSFERPENDNNSVGHVKGFTKDMDPHYSSGVYRRVFYVIVKQKDTSIKDAFQVFLHANRMYWHPMASFEECACGTLKAALDLGISKSPFERGFLDVGITPCDVTKFVFTVVANKTYDGINVSADVKPLFRFVTPVWADTVTIQASSMNGIIAITVQNETWFETDDDESANVIAEGDSEVSIQDVGEAEFFFELSTAGNTVLSDVSLRALYNCALNFPTEDEMVTFYKYVCFGEHL
ncbi:hypothetical protein CHS0354_024240 [Potamilus streckersoni]|uniref:Neutral metalloproteinase n=1 Tax=Potamilus streckersoni TaxID=2493646 RepID=A0AAE0SCE2_9BIVA|nr:hypothetical protein CHS0354_024240 [Potamilus streckersoni]